MQSRLLAFLLVVTSAFGLRAAEGRWKAPADPAMQTQRRQNAAEAPGEMLEVIVRFREPAGGLTTDAVARRRAAIDARAAELQRDLDRLDAGRTVTGNAERERPRVRRTFHRVLFGAAARIPREMRASLRALPYVASVQQNVRVEALLYESTSRIRAPQTWAQMGTRGAGVTVAVIDTGVDYTHPILGGGFGAGFKVAGGWDFVDDDPDPMDPSGHGTHVAGIIAGEGNGLVGIAPGVTLLAYRTLGPQGGYASDVIAAIERCVDPDGDGNSGDHVDVVNMSLGGMAIEDDPIAAAVESATAAGVFFSIAAGNTHHYGDVLTPAIAPSALAVGAADDGDVVADFSSRGPAYDFGIKPEVTAPGVNIVSAWSNGNYVEANGTSMAAPHVAGVAALVKAVHPGWTPAQIKSAIVASSIPLDGDVMANGAGRVDALNATTVATLVSPEVVSFGQINALQDVWTASRTVTLSNVSSAAQTLTASVQGMRDGVQVTVTPQVVEIAPGASATVKVDIAVTNAAVPAAKEGSLSYGGRIAWSGGGVPIHVPWAFVKGAFLTIVVPDARNEVLGEVLGSRWSWQTDFFIDSWRVYWPLEEVDIVLDESPSSATDWLDRIVVAERVDTFRTPRVTIPLAPAQFRVVAQTTDESGGPLAAAGRECSDFLTLAFPSGRKYSRQQAPDYRPFFGPMSDRVKVHLMHSCADSATETMYAAMHEPLRGLQGDVTSTLQPEWLRQDVRFAGATEGHLTEALATLRFPGPQETYYFAGGWYFLMRPTGPSLTVRYTKSPSPEVELMALLGRVTRCHDPSLGHDVDCPMYSDAFVYFDEGGVRVDGDLYFDVSPMAYRVPRGKTMVLGGGPVWAQQGFGRSRELWVVSASWRGAAGERLTVPSAGVRAIVRDGAGTIIADVPGGYLAKWEQLPVGAYTIETSNPNSFVGGIAGAATITSSLDMLKPDPLYPWFTGVRIENGGGLHGTVFEPNASATLVFSVADLRSEYPWMRRVPPREEATRVEYRRRGTAEWLPLAPMLHARHYQNNNFLNAGVGTMYRVDLSTVTRDVRGAIDLRIHAEDTSGNAVELRLEPALYVGERTKSRAVRR